MLLKRDISLCYCKMHFCRVIRIFGVRWGEPRAQALHQGLKCPPGPAKAVLLSPHCPLPIFLPTRADSPHSALLRAPAHAGFSALCGKHCVALGKYLFYAEVHQIFLLTQILEPFQFPVLMSWNSTFLLMYFLLAVLKNNKLNISHAANDSPFHIPIPQPLECSFLQNSQEELPRFILLFYFTFFSYFLIFHSLKMLLLSDEENSFTLGK